MQSQARQSRRAKEPIEIREPHYPGWFRMCIGGCRNGPWERNCTVDMLGGPLGGMFVIVVLHVFMIVQSLMQVVRLRAASVGVSSKQEKRTEG